MQLLHIDSAITGDQSTSRQLTADIVRAWQAQHPDTQVQYLDLAQDTPAHYTADALALRFGQTEGLSAAQQRENAVTERLLQQFLAADVLVIGAPMYNFTIPTQLKSWIDRLAQPGRTFRYTATGPKAWPRARRCSWPRRAAACTQPARPGAPWSIRKASCRRSSAFLASPMSASCVPKASAWATRPGCRP